LDDLILTPIGLFYKNVGKIVELCLTVKN